MSLRTAGVEVPGAGEGRRMRWSIRWKLVLAIGMPLLLVYAVMLTVMVEQIRVRAHAELESGVTALTAHCAARRESVRRHPAAAA